MVRNRGGWAGTQLAFLGLGQLLLDAVDSINAVDEENQNEDECYLGCCQPGTNAWELHGHLHPILELGYDRTVGDEGKELALRCVW